MNFDFRVPTDFFAHRKTRELVRRGGDSALVALLRLWAWAAQNRYADGSLEGYSAKEIAALAAYTGARDFIGMLEQIGFLDRLPSGEFVIHQWAEHQPFCAQLDWRKERARKGGIARAAGVHKLRAMAR